MPVRVSPAQVQRHLLDRYRAAILDPHEQRSVVPGRQAESRSPLAQPAQIDRVQHLAQGQLRELLRRGSGVDQRAGHPVLAGQRGLRQEAGAQLVQLVGGLAGERRDEAGVRGDPAVDLLRRVVVGQLDVDRADAGHGAHGVVGVGHHEEGEVRRAEERRQAQPHPHGPVGADLARLDEVEGGDRLVELRVEHRVQRGVHRVAVDPRQDRGHAGAPSGCSTSFASSWAAGVPASSGSRSSSGTSMP
jgi:hypothetical protein